MRSSALLLKGCFSRSIFSCMSNLLARPMSLHQLGVAHQPSLRSLRTMMSYSNSLQLKEAGSLFRGSVTAAQDHCSGQASPHGHYRSSVAFGRGDITLGIG